MNIFKKIIRKLLKFFGYKLQKTSDKSVKMRHFKNLALAYEQLLNESEHFIPPNKVRLRLLANLIGINPFEAYYIVNAIAKNKKSPGDVCEFGVAQGATSVLIANEIKTGQKILHLFDTFEGLSKPSENDRLNHDPLSLGSIEAYEGALAFLEKKVRARLRGISFPMERVVIHSGLIDKVLKEDSNLPKEVSVAFVDFDFYEPIKSALDFLHQTTSVGAIIIVHDYDGFVTGTKTAVDEFLTDKNANALTYEFFSKARYGCIAILTRVG